MDKVSLEDSVATNQVAANQVTAEWVADETLADESVADRPMDGDSQSRRRTRQNSNSGPLR